MQKSGNKCVKLCQVSNCKRPTNFFFIELTFSKTAYYELQYQHSMLILWLIDKKTTCSWETETHLNIKKITLLTCPPLRPGPTDPPMTVSAICVKPVWYQLRKKKTWLMVIERIAQCLSRISFITTELNTDEQEYTVMGCTRSALLDIINQGHEDLYALGNRAFPALWARNMMIGPSPPLRVLGLVRVTFF